MSSRGRGYGVRGTYVGRGGYRGSNYRGSSYRGTSYRGNTRGSYESRGRGNYNSHYGDTRYTSSSNERYNSSRDRMDDSYKKPYRSETTSNYSRDYMSRGGSPDRKRMRMEGSGDRRSHDGGHFGSSYSSRPDSYGERRTFGEERRRSPSREGYRKSVMAPPRSPSRMSAPRSRVMRVSRSYRGRTLRTRSTYRGSLRARASYFPRRFGDRTSEYTRSFRYTKMRSAIKAKADSASSTEGEDWDTEEKEGAGNNSKEIKSKMSPKMSAGETKGDEELAGGDTDKEGGDAASDDNLPRSKFTGKKFISLFCLHCKEKYITFGGYSKHLLSGKHRASMGAVARRHKAQLLRMRMAQRNAQRELEESEDTELTEDTHYCIVCKLNYRTTKHEHSQTEAHAAMKRFLMPSCKICQINFRSPMIYEHHICSLEHIKRKARGTARPASPKAEGSGDEGMDVDLDNFMTLDSVGDVDEVDDEDSGADKKADDEKKPPKKEINIGSEHIKKVEVYWCELCKMYLRRVDTPAEEADVLRRHCRVRTHLGHYVRHRDTRTLRKQAERIHRQLQKQRENAKEESAAEEKGDKMDTEKKSLENGTEDISGNGGGEDKLWADVDKDIGDLLREVDPTGTKSSDDEEDLGRYDKFRKSDKKLDGSVDAVTEGTGVAVDPTEAVDIAVE